MGNVKLSELAERAGVSLTTVSRALNKSGYVAKEVAERIDRAIEETGYVHPARKNPLYRDNLIGVITLQSTLSPYLGVLTQALRDKAEESGYYALQVSTTDLDNDALTYHVKRLAAIGVCGLVVCSFNSSRLESETRAVLNRSGVPVVFLERAPDCHGFNRVLVDNELGTYSATRHLIKRGHRHLVYISLDKKMDAELSRTNGFLKAVEQEPKGSIVHRLLYCKTITPIEAAGVMREAMTIDPAISGVITWNDVYAAGAVHYFTKVGRIIPDEIEVIGHDNVLAPHLAQPISSVAMPIDEMAAAAVEIISRSQDQKSLLTPRTITLEPRLVLQNQASQEE